MTRPITERMAEAKARMIAARRVPCAFYLGTADHAEYMATEPETISALFRGKSRREPGYDGVAVRPGTGRDQRGNSRLYCSSGTSLGVPVAVPPAPPNNLPASSLSITRRERENRGLAPSGRQVNQQRILDGKSAEKAAVEQRINLCRRAHDLRRPGETLHAATKRLQSALADG